jgi:hypothetical protein
MKKTQACFIRNEGGSTDALIVVEFTHDPRLEGPKAVMEAFEKGITAAFTDPDETSQTK